MKKVIAVGESIGIREQVQKRLKPTPEEIARAHFPDNLRAQALDAKLRRTGHLEDGEKQELREYIRQGMGRFLDMVLRNALDRL